MSQQNMDWFVGFGQYKTEQTQEFNILHFAFREHHRDSEANSLNELRPAWPNCRVQHGVACAWHRRCTVERKLKCSNVNMWRPDFGESLRSFHSKRLFCNLLQHCARISYYRKTSKGYFLCGSTWYPIWVNEDACFEACKDLRRLLDIDPNIQDREWMIIQLCHGCRWSSKTTQLFDLFCCLILYLSIEFNFFIFPCTSYQVWESDMSFNRITGKEARRLWEKAALIWER